MDNVLDSIKNISIFSEYPLAMPLLVVGISLFLVLVTVDTLTSSFRSLTKAKKLIKVRKKHFQLLKTQTNAVRVHASSYANTLGGEGAKLLSELTKIVHEQEEILNSLEAATRSWDIEEILRIQEEPTVANKDLFVEKLKRAETIIGYISARLIEASITSTKLNIPKIRKSQSTIDGLSSVGLAVRNPTDEFET